MKKLTLFLLACCLSSTGITQSDMTSRLSLGLEFSTDMAFRSLKNKDQSFLYQNIIDERAIVEIPRFGYTSGIQFAYAFNPLLSLELGVKYASRGFDIYYHDAAIVLYPFYTEDLLKVRYQQIYQYIDLPLRLNFTIGNKAVKFSSGIGLSTNFFLRQSVHFKQTYTDHVEKGSTFITKKDVSYLNSVNVAPFIAIGMCYDINEKMFMRIEPVVKYGIISTTNTPIREHLFEFGINFGYFLRF
jgi:hypothetical protein